MYSILSHLAFGDVGVPPVVLLGVEEDVAGGDVGVLGGNSNTFQTRYGLNRPAADMEGNGRE